MIGTWKQLIGTREQVTRTRKKNDQDPEVSDASYFQPGPARQYNDGGKAALFGGAAEDGNMSNYVFVLDMIFWEWTDVKVTGKKGMLTPLAGPCLCTLSNDCAIVFGRAKFTEGRLNVRADLRALRFSADWKWAEWELIVDVVV